MSEIFCVIMAGGRGERFWPRSRRNRPKQLLNLLGSGSLLEQTVLRLQGFVDPRKTLIITSRQYEEQIRELCPQIPEQNVIGEPCSRNTAPCAALAAGAVAALAETEDPVMLFLPSDHYIVNRNAMISDFSECIDAAVALDALGTIGIVPEGPSSEYGYIECGEKVAGHGSMHRVLRFLEKPTRDVAVKLLAKGNYKWNSGMFVFPLTTFRRELKEHAPDLLAISDKIAAAWHSEDLVKVMEQEYEAVRKISIDYAVMEHASRIVEKDASFDWDDIGNWTALRNHSPADENGNVIAGNALLLESSDCIVFSDDPDAMIAGIDLHDMAVIKSGDAFLVCPTRSAGKIKKLLAELAAKENFSHYL